MELVDAIALGDSQRMGAVLLSRWRHGFESRWGCSHAEVGVDLPRPDYQVVFRAAIENFFGIP